MPKGEKNCPTSIVEFVNTYRPLWRKKPLVFFADVLDVDEAFIWDKMREIANSVRDYERTAVKAAHSVSKTFTAARLVLWFLYSHYPSTVITTAPTHNQVEEILWREVRLAHANAKIPLPGKITKTGLDLGEKWFATGFSTRPDTVTQQATRFQGFHNEHVLIIKDEAAGIEKAIWEAADSLMTSGFCRLLAIGNPTSASGEFVDCFKSKAYNKITISVFDTPNYKYDAEIIPGLSGRKYVEHTKEKYGEDSNYYKARVLGQIPDEDIDALFSLTAIEKSVDNDLDDWNFKKRYVTWDVADGGDDAHVIYGWHNTTIIDQARIVGKKIEEAEPYVWRMLRKIDGNAIIVDSDGVGRVAVGYLEKSADASTDIIPFQGSLTNKEEIGEDFASLKAKSAWEARRLMEEGKIGIPDDDMLIEELQQYKLDNERRDGKIGLEKKKLMRERLTRSPDAGDNVIMMAGKWTEVKTIGRRKDKYNHPRSSSDDDYGWRSA